jgi:hypothetical protein
MQAHSVFEAASQFAAHGHRMISRASSERYTHCADGKLSNASACDLGPKVIERMGRVTECEDTDTVLVDGSRVTER